MCPKLSTAQSVGQAPSLAWPGHQFLGPPEATRDDLPRMHPIDDESASNEVTVGERNVISRSRVVIDKASAPFASTRSIVGMRVRSFKRNGWRLVGRGQRHFSGGWTPVIAWFVGAVLVLEFVPLVLQRLIQALWNVGLWQELGAKKMPAVGQWFSVPVLIGVFVAGLIVRALVRARNRVVIDQFVDYTQEDGTAVEGLATLLVAELSSLSQLYRQVNDQLSIPLAVGAEQRGGFGRGKEAGTFLTVRADDVSDLLQGAVAAEVKIEMAGIMIPVGAVLALLGRLVRGPRILGSVHRTDAGGGPTLTAQLVGRGPITTWRVDHRIATPPASAMAYVPRMVAEMAVRMFTDLSFGDGARWRAVQEFTRYLRSYQECLRAPRHRTRLLKEAEARLIQAVAEDDGFDLAFYNLGVIYSQLAQEELTGAQSSDVVRWRWDIEPDDIRQARITAATMAFTRALDRNPGRWEAHYALAVHRFASMKALKPGESADPEQADALAEVERLCRRVLELRPQSAYADDLLGMALVRLGRFDEGIKHHRRAVRRWWRKLCRAERLEAARPTPRPTQLLLARANATAALHNLGLAQMSQGMRSSSLRRLTFVRRLSLFRAGLYFRQAAKLAPPQTAAACRFEHGCARESWHDHAPHARRKLKKAAHSFRKAIRIQPDNAEYHAALARVLAKEKGRDHAQTQQAVDAALDCLAPVYARAVERFPPRSVAASCTATLDALEEPLGTTASKESRVAALRHLRDQLAHDLAPCRTRDVNRSVAALEEQLASMHLAPEQRAANDSGGSNRNADWEQNQVALALARLYGRTGRWKDCLTLLEGTIERLTSNGREIQIGRLGLHIRCAQAQRHLADAANGGRCRAGLGDALKSAELGLRIDPLSSAGRREAGRIHFALGQFHEAINAWNQALSLIPNDPFLYLKLGVCYWQIAEQRRGTAASRCSSLEQATTSFKESLILSGSEYKEGKAWAHLWLGRAMIERGELEEAIGHLSSAAAFEQTRLAANVLLGEAFTAARRYGPARAALRTALREPAASSNGTPLSRQDDEEYVEDLTPDKLRRRARRALLYAYPTRAGWGRARPGSVSTSARESQSTAPRGA